MIELDASQLQQLRIYLEEHVQRAPELREEMVDHLACAVESRMSTGESFESARDAVLRDWSPQRLRRTERRVHYLLTVKPKRMRYFAWAGVIALVAVLLIGLIPESEAIVARKSCPEETRGKSTLFPDESPFRFLIRNEVLHEEEEDLYYRFASNLVDPPSGSPVREFSPREVTIGYGWYTHPIKQVRKLHWGIDIRGRLGTPVLSTGAGVVAKAAHDEKGYGKHIIIRHDDEYETLYAHLDEMLVSVGDPIDLGTVIGKIGSTGLSTGPHLHYEVLKNGKRVDPETYLP